MDSKESVYLEIGDAENNQVNVPIYTYISVFVVNYCQNIDVNIYFVKTNVSSKWFIPLQAVQHLKIKFIEKEKLPQRVKDSHLPALVSGDNQTCVGGLCAVLRWTIKAKCKISQDDHCESLLGFRGGCLTACSESSIWTKFVEVDMPQTVAKFQEQMNSDKPSAMIPLDLMRLEMHLRYPVKTHNILKRKQEFFKETKRKQDTVSSEANGLFNLADLNDSVSKIQIKECYSKGKGRDKNCNHVNLPHHFVEGIDFTLADVILLLCVHQLLTLLRPWKRSLEHHIPLVLAWYSRILENKHTVKATKFWKFNSWNDIIEEQESELLVPIVKNESLYSRDSSRSKPRIRNRDPTELANKLTAAGILPHYTTYPSDGYSRINWETLPRAVHPAGGDLPPVRIERKCQQIESIVTAVLSLATPNCVIVDFCAGGGHVGLLIAYLLPECKIILIENKESSMDRARARTKELQLKNVFFFQCNMDYFQGNFDIGVCLHACGVATDLVIQQCLNKKASFVCCPCCYGSIHNSHLLKYPRSRRFSECGIKYEEYLFLCHCADRTEVATPKVEEGKYCMSIIDMDRYYYATENNYTMKLCTLQPPTCTPKCNLLIGIHAETNILLQNYKS